GFAPTAAAVHPATGDLYLSIGGRGTRGAVYRVRHIAGAKKLDPAEVKRWQPATRSLDWKAGLGKTLLAQAAGKDLHQRRRAPGLIRRQRAKFSASQVERAVRASAGSADRYLRQAAARLLLSLPEKEQERIGKLLKSPLERTTWRLARPGWDIVDLLK